jgi:hypothetical protein
MRSGAPSSGAPEPWRILMAITDRIADGHPVVGADCQGFGG